jgi:hypothetical protein
MIRHTKIIPGLPFQSSIRKIRHSEPFARMKPCSVLGHPICAMMLAFCVPHPTTTTIGVRPLKETIGA